MSVLTFHELDKMPVGAVIADWEGDTYVKTSEGDWQESTSKSLIPTGILVNWSVRKTSTPEPDPKPEGKEITPELLAWLRGRGMNYVAQLVLDRDTYGRTKYGQPLMSEDGRDSVEDCLQELGDALQYAWCAKLKGSDVTALLGPAQALVQLLFEIAEVER